MAADIRAQDGHGPAAWHALAAAVVIGVTVLTVVLERRHRPARA